MIADACKEPKVEVVSIKAGDGDCILIRCLGPLNYTIMIDGGRASTVANFRQYLATLSECERKIDLLVLTHIDADHIGGALTIARDDILSSLIKDVWFNDSRHLRQAGSACMGPDQGDAFASLIKERKWSWNRHFDHGPVVRDHGTDKNQIVLAPNLFIHLISPTREALLRLAREWPVEEIALLDTTSDDTPPHSAMGRPPEPNVVLLARTPYDADRSAANGSSIAFLLTYHSFKLLVLADAHAETVEHAIKNDLGSGPFEVDLATLPHHGGPRNTSPDLASLVDAKQWLVSTTGRHGHPHGASIARILARRNRSKTTILNFNSNHDETLQWDSDMLKAQFDYQTRYALSEDNWLTVFLK